LKRTLNSIVIHCSATPNGRPFNAVDIDSMHQLRKFKRDSQAIRNFNPNLKSIGYHFVILVDGTIETGRGLEEIGAHVQGNNAHSIGICMIGTDKFSKAQFDSLRQLIIDLAGRIRGSICATGSGALNSLHDMGIKVCGHRDFSPDLNGNGIIERNEWLKICPGFDVATWIKGGMMPIQYV